MAWSASKVFMATLEDMFENTCAMDLNSDTFKVPLYDNDITPSQTVTSANTAFNAGQWATSGNEVVDASGWPTGGRSLASVASGFSSNVYTFDAADTTSANANTTLSANHGGLIYDDTLTTPVADQGLCYIYFGGAQQVTAGTFTIVWHSDGIIKLTA